MSKWLKFDIFNATSNPSTSGVSAGFYDDNTMAFVGRARVFNSYQPGRIESNINGIFYTYQGIERFTNESVEFLVANANYNYGWIKSENGSFVANAVTLNVPKSASQYIGRKIVGNSTFIGAVVRVMGGIYFADYSGVEKFSSEYDVLICTLPPGERTFFNGSF